VSEDGLPVWIAAADPRWWCAHKLWLAEASGREPIKRQRDRDQAYAVAGMLAHSWDADLSDEVLAAIPTTWRSKLRLAVEMATLPVQQ
jgi:hypothetical protein